MSRSWTASGWNLSLRPVTLEGGTESAPDPVPRNQLDPSGFDLLEPTFDFDRPSGLDIRIFFDLEALKESPSNVGASRRRKPEGFSQHLTSLRRHAPILTAVGAVLLDRAWERDPAIARRLQQELEAGVVTINDCVSSYGEPTASWGGFKRSGIAAPTERPRSERWRR